jgi:hypothetical protein
MGNAQSKLETFFSEYEKLYNGSLTGEADIESTVRSFAQYFVEASPVGIIGGKNDDEFRKRIPQGFAFYKGIGTESMNIRSKEISSLDELHQMTKVGWTAKCRKKDGKEEVIDFTVIYFTQLQNGEPKIFAYITGDEQKVLKERGLI